jgi:DNA-binding HxlR family transcriptional regulator
MIGQVKTYGQRCPLARALNVIGERWSLLVVRELMLGPRRFTDLLDGLPGIPTNMLTTRLKDLQAAGILTKRTLPPPTAVTVYELTEAGRALGPALAELRDWGSRYGSPTSRTDAMRPAWALVSASSRPTAIPPGRICELRVDAEAFQLTDSGAGLHVRGGAAQAPDSVVTIAAETLYRLMAGRTTAAAARRQTRIDGDPTVAQAALDALPGALAGPAKATTRLT